MRSAGLCAAAIAVTGYGSSAHSFPGLLRVVQQKQAAVPSCLRSHLQLRLYLQATCYARSIAQHSEHHDGNYIVWVKQSFACKAMDWNTMTLLALFGGTAQGQRILNKLHSSVREPCAVVHIQTVSA